MLNVISPLGLIINKNEKAELLRVCIDNNIYINYTESFTDGLEHYLWVITKSGIGLVGPIIMRNLKETNHLIIHGVNEFENYLLSNNK